MKSNFTTNAARNVADFNTSADVCVCGQCAIENGLAVAAKRRRFLGSLGAAAGYLTLGGSALAADLSSPPKAQNVVSPDGALNLLMKGNARYVEGVSKRHDFKHEREALVAGQNPMRAF